MMTLTQQIVTIAMVILGTMPTRFVPFFVFPAGKPTPKYVQYLGNVLPPAVFGLLIIYCLKNVSIFTGSHAIPELLAITLVIALHTWKRQMLLSIAGGTIFYMILVQFIFLRRLGHLPKLYLLTFIFGIFTPKMPPVALSKNQKLTSDKRLLAFSHVKMLYFPRKNTKKMTLDPASWYHDHFQI